jgi:F0F1-type ATP synthase delta subunit
MLSFVKTGTFDTEDILQNNKMSDFLFHPQQAKERIVKIFEEVKDIESKSIFL